MQTPVFSATEDKMKKLLELRDQELAFALSENARLVEGTVFNLPFGAASFDAVIGQAPDGFAAATDSGRRSEPCSAVPGRRRQDAQALGPRATRRGQPPRPAALDKNAR